MKTTDDGYAQPGIGLVSVGWMGKLHSRAYQAIPLAYPELKIRPRFVHAADTAPDRADYACTATPTSAIYNPRPAGQPLINEAAH